MEFSQLLDRSVSRLVGKSQKQLINILQILKTSKGRGLI